MRVGRFRLGSRSRRRSPRRGRRLLPHLEELDFLDRLVDDRRDGQGGGEDDERDDGDHRTVTEAQSKGQNRCAARRHTGPSVWDDRAQAHHWPPGLPEARKPRNGGLARGQGVTFYLHVDKKLRQDPENGRPEEYEPYLRGDEGSDDQLARRHP